MILHLQWNYPLLHMALQPRTLLAAIPIRMCAPLSFPRARLYSERHLAHWQDFHWQSWWLTKFSLITRLIDRLVMYFWLDWQDFHWHLQWLTNLSFHRLQRWQAFARTYTQCLSGNCHDIVNEVVSSYDSGPQQCFIVFKKVKPLNIPSTIFQALKQDIPCMKVKS